MRQEEALDILKLGCNVFLTGPPGSGKTFLLNKYIDYLKRHGKRVAITASTGIAATHMQGVTIHSWSGLGIKEKLTDEDIRKLSKKSYLRKRFRQTNVLIIDEISMLHAFQFDLLNRICQRFKESIKPFGGMQVVCSGDLFQLPPVQKGGEAKFVPESEVWQSMALKICYLEEQYRQKDKELLALLNSIRHNAINESHRLLLHRKYREDVFSIAPTKLYTHNIDVNTINTFELNKIREKEFVYHMYAEGAKSMVDILKKSCLAPERLMLKRGAKVMFVKNNFGRGYVNGTLGKVIGFDENSRPVIETFTGEQIVATPASWTIEEDEKVIAEITQFPLRLAWAITVHKSQGMNLDAAEIDLSKSFVKGMGYVALSRVCSLAGIKLKGINKLALSVKEEILELDKEFKQLSREVVADFRKMGLQEGKREQREFLRSLPQIKRGKPLSTLHPTKLGEGSTYEQSKILVSRKLSIKEIAQQRGLSENTIMGHLEKLAKNEEELDLEYLRLPQNRFEKIKAAFQESGGWQLNPVREILGEDFSYRELRLARLFLDKDRTSKDK